MAKLEKQAIVMVCSSSKYSLFRDLIFAMFMTEKQDVIKCL